MIDWNLIAKIAGGGFGVTMIVLTILAVVTWLIGLVLQKATKTTTVTKADSGKGK